MLRFAANLSTMFREWPFLDRFDAAADAGFEFVECQFPYEAAADRIAGRLQKAGLQMVMFNTPPGDLAAGELGFAALGNRTSDFRDSLKEAAAYARMLGVEQLHMLAGRASKNDAALVAFEQSVAWAADYLALDGISVLIEPVNAVDNPGYFLSDLDVAADIITRLARPNVALQFDTYHCRMSGLDLMESLVRFLAITGHIQISSVPGRAEPNAEDIAALSQIERLGYSGIVGCEYVPSDGTLAGLGWRKGF